MEVLKFTITLTTKPLIRKLLEKNCISLVVFRFFLHTDVDPRLFKLNIKARHKKREFLNANLWLIHLIGFVDIDRSWNIFTLHNFCSIEHLIDLENVRTENLKFRTDLRDRVMEVWSVTLYMNVYKDRLLQKSSNRKWELILSTLVSAGHEP